MVATERDKSSRGESLNSMVSVTFAVEISSSGGDVFGKRDSVHTFLLGGFSGLSSSVGVERLREIGEMGAMVDVHVCVAFERTIE